jgi:hypothetical protein
MAKVLVAPASSLSHAKPRRNVPSISGRSSLSSVGWQPQRRQANADGLDDWDEEDASGNEPVEQPLEEQRGNSTTPSSLSSGDSTDGGDPKSFLMQRPDSPDRAYVTVKQTALNPYTYKLRISIAKMRPNDFGEYVCTSSNSMGTSSARVLVKSEFSTRAHHESPTEKPRNRTNTCQLLTRHPLPQEPNEIQHQQWRPSNQIWLGLIV